MEKLKIKVIQSTTREGRFGEQPANWIFNLAKDVSEFEVEMLDLRDYPMPYYDEEITPTRITTPYSHKEVAKWTKKIEEADGFIIVTAEYNHGYPAVLKNALDYVYKEWNNKPVGFVGYGSVGGARAVEQLRQVVVELQMAPIRQGVHFNEYWNILDDNGKLKTENHEASAKILLEQLLGWAKALKEVRN